MTGLTDELRNNFHAMKAIATTTKPRADVRIQEAASFVKQLGAQIKGKDGTLRNNIFTDWGVQICPDPIKFPDKFLPPGALLMAQNKRVDIRTGNLDRETQAPMFKNGAMTRWAVFYCQRDEGPCQTFLQEIDKVNKDFQFGMSNPLVKTIQDGRNEG